MPTLLLLKGYRFFFFSNEGAKPPHVHVEYGGGLLKVWLDPVDVAQNYGFGPKNVRFALSVIDERQREFLEAWHVYFG